MRSGRAAAAAEKAPVWAKSGAARGSGVSKTCRASRVSRMKEEWSRKTPQAAPAHIHKHTHTHTHAASEIRGCQFIMGHPDEDPSDEPETGQLPPDCASSVPPTGHETSIVVPSLMVETSSLLLIEKVPCICSL
mmetsp:Transcript_11159/g.29992  ORF Transcript_11159/g.29992 Transcript_11159/m.29992 type:complete len:134 (-) Transcript_11159:966-1367(-)